MQLVHGKSVLALCGASLLVLGIGVAASFGQTQGPSAGASGSLPTAEQVVDRYVKAIGGRVAVMRITSRHMRGTAEFVGAPVSATFESFEKAPNKSMVVFEIQGMKVREGFDGRMGWSAEPDGVREHTGAELEESIRESDFYEDVNLLKRYAKLSVVDRAPVDGRDAYRLQGAFADGTTEMLYFEVESGFLFRKITQKPGPDGERTEYEMGDYREVDGVKMPFTAKARSKDQQIVMRITEIKHNVAIDDSQFAKPAAP